MKRSILTGLTGIAGPALWAAARVRVAQWDHRARSPERAQTATLLAHCATAAHTEFGRAHGLGEVRSYKDFAARVPVRSYAGFEPYLTRMRKGERDILGHDDAARIVVSDWRVSTLHEISRFAYRTASGRNVAN